VLYLLHGWSDDHTIWQRRTSIERYAAEYPLAVVMPSTHLGWYTNQKYGLRYYEYIAEELPRIVREFFPQLSDRREDTFVAGLSMGGYGALKLGLRAHDTFSACASLSGAADVAGELHRNQHPVFKLAFGSAEEAQGSEDDLFHLADVLPKEKRPRVYQWCGTEDFLIESNRKFKAHLESLGYDLTYSESPGDHQWKYWDTQIEQVLAWLFA